MERTVSRPPQSGGANWAVFFAPLAVTAVVILAAVVFVWSSDPEPAERPEVKAVELVGLEPAHDTTRLSSVPRAEPSQTRTRQERVRPSRLGFSPVGAGSESSASGPRGDDNSDDDDKPRREYTLDEPREGKRGLREAVNKLPFMGPALARIQERRAEKRAGAKASDQEASPSDSEETAGVVPSGAASGRTETSEERDLGAAGAGPL